MVAFRPVFGYYPALMQRIYLDYAAATPVDPRVERAMRPFLRAHFGNPSSVHAEGRAARAAVDAARRDVAQAIGARPDEVIFTNGVTEAINIALSGVLKASGDMRHVVTVATEHHAGLRVLERDGVEVTIVPVDADGVVKVDAVLAAIRPDTALVSVMHANNEIGTVAPIAEIGKAIEKLRRTTKRAYPVFHTDAAQSPQFLAVDVQQLHVDLASFSGQKMYGPKATGALFVKTGTPITSILFGGGQEHGLRPGTENVAGIVGFAKALTIATAERLRVTSKVAALADRLRKGLLVTPGTRCNSSADQRLPNIVNISFSGVDGEALVMYLDQHGVAVSSASSCTGAQSISHVLRALGLSDDGVKGSVRFSLGRATTRKDIDRAIAAVHEILAILK